MPLSRDQVAGLTGPSVVEVDVPEWGDSILVRVISASEFLEYANHVRDNQESKDSMVDLVVLAAVDQSGKALFKKTDRPVIDALGWKGLKRLSEQIARINGFYAGEEAEGNS